MITEQDAGGSLVAGTYQLKNQALRALATAEGVLMMASAPDPEAHSVADCERAQAMAALANAWCYVGAVYASMAT